jgi:hypothetical protein
VRLSLPPRWTSTGLALQWRELAENWTDGPVVCEVRYDERLKGWLVVAFRYGMRTGVTDRHGNLVRGKRLAIMRARSQPDRSVVFRSWREVVEHLRQVAMLASDVEIPAPRPGGFAAKHDRLVAGEGATTVDWRPAETLPEDQYA